jgi:hypothetical protein
MGCSTAEQLLAVELGRRRAVSRRSPLTAGPQLLGSGSLVLAQVAIGQADRQRHPCCLFEHNAQKPKIAHCGGCAHKRATVTGDT